MGPRVRIRFPPAESPTNFRFLRWEVYLDLGTSSSPRCPSEISQPSRAAVADANAITGANRMRAAAIKLDAQFRILLIAPSRILTLFHSAGAAVNGCLIEANPTTW